MSMRWLVAADMDVFFSTHKALYEYWLFSMYVFCFIWISLYSTDDYILIDVSSKFIVVLRKCSTEFTFIEPVRSSLWNLMYLSYSSIICCEKELCRKHLLYITLKSPYTRSPVCISLCQYATVNASQSSTIS
jgi:hypothetical protein